MSGSIKHPRPAALEVARELTVSLKPAAEDDRFIFAGSLRRRKAEVGDVEVVYVPRFANSPDPDDLFGRDLRQNCVDRVLNEWLRSGRLTKRTGEKSGRTSWGEENKLARHSSSGIGVDFFQANQSNFWSLMVCRTGPKEFNASVCVAAEQRGLKWDPYRGFVNRLNEAEIVFVPGCEWAVFKFFNWPYLEPWERR